MVKIVITVLEFISGLWLMSWFNYWQVRTTVDFWYPVRARFPMSHAAGHNPEKHGNQFLYYETCVVYIIIMHIDCYFVEATWFTLVNQEEKTQYYTESERSSIQRSKTWVRVDKEKRSSCHDQKKTVNSEMLQQKTCSKRRKIAVLLLQREEVNVRSIDTNQKESKLWKDLLTTGVSMPR